ncbi:phage major capsid protein [Cellulosimicrobium cellulans]|uniref:phage major capsid protein n=1 Tax=Cellulosimicrobium cellulans TaxID=1710 RepID=UPI0035D99239
MSSTTGISRSTLTEQLKRHKEAADAAIGQLQVDGKGRFSIDSEPYKDYQDNLAAAQEVKGLLDGMDELKNIDKFLNEPVGTPSAASGLSNPQDLEVKSLADVFTRSEEYRRFAESGQGIGRQSVMVGELEGKSIFNLSAGTVSRATFGGGTDRGLTERPLRKERVRDLFEASTTKDAMIFGVRETGWVNNAGIVKQRNAAGDGWPAPAPESSLTFVTDTFPVAEVAHTLTAHKNILADEPRLRAFLNGRMIDGIKYKEDFELLHGVGGTEAITGLFNTPDVQEYAGLATDKYSIQIRRAITKSLLAEYQPNGIVVSPTMWEAIEIETDDNGAFRVAVAVAIGAEKRVWRLNVVETTAMSDENFLVGAFRNGATLHDREKVSVSVSSEHADNFSKGLVTFRADERIALEVNRPESFVVGTWTAPTP